MVQFPTLAHPPAPRSLTGPGRLHLRFSLLTSMQKVVDRLRDSPWSWAHDDHLISVQIPGTGLLSVLDPLAACLASYEQQEVRVVFEPAGGPPQLADYFETGSLARFLARRQSGWLIDMIREDRLTSVFQPIVDAGNGRVFGYECLLRGIDAGQLVASAPILRVAGGSGLLFHLDQTARWLALREAARHGIRNKLFINFTPSALDHPDDCLQATVRLLDALGIPRRQVVFEIVESERFVDVARLERILAHYRELDFGVALDDVGAGYASLNLLQGLRPDYSKLDLQLVRDVHRDSYKAVITAKLLEASQALGVKTIAEGVESEDECQWLRSHGADYLQGFHFAPPASPPPLI